MTKKGGVSNPQGGFSLGDHKGLLSRGGWKAKRPPIFVKRGSDEKRTEFFLVLHSAKKGGRLWEIRCIVWRGAE